MAIHRAQALDQAALTWMESQAATIESQVRMEELAKVMYPELVSVDQSMDEASDVLVSYIARPGTGRMTPLAAGATDIPKTEVSYDRILREAYMSGISYGWDDDEVRKARRLGHNLLSDRVTTAFEVAEREKESVVLNGNADYGWTGLITNREKACLSITAANEWSAANTVQAVNDIRAAFYEIRSTTNKVMMPDTLLLPVSAESFLTSMIKDSATTTPIPVIEYIRKYNPYTLMTGNPLMIKTINELSNAGPEGAGSANEATGTDAKAKVTGHPMAVLYDSRPKVLRFLMPQDLTFIGPQRQAWTQTYYGRMKLGGVQIFHPKGICYISNIGSVA